MADLPKVKKPDAFVGFPLNENSAGAGTMSRPRLRRSGRPAWRTTAATPPGSYTRRPGYIAW